MAKKKTKKKTKAATTAVTKAATTALPQHKELPSTVQAALEDEVSRIRDAAVANIQGYWDFGDWLMQLLKDPEGWGFKKGQKPLDQMDGVVYAESTMRQILYFRKSYNKTRLKSLCNARFENGKPLTWGHVIQLLSVEDPVKRTEMQKVTIQDNLDPKELAARIHKMHGGKKSGGGRPLSVPKTLNAGLHQVQNMSKQWMDRQEQVWNGDKFNLFEHLDSMDLDDINNKMIDELENMAKQQSKLAEAASSNAKSLRDRADKFRDALEGDEDAEVAPEEPKKAAKNKATKKKATKKAAKKPAKKAADKPPTVTQPASGSALNRSSAARRRPVGAA